MVAILLQVFEHALMGICLTSISLVFFSLAALLRLLPRLLSFTRLCLRGLLILSYRLYYLLLSTINPSLRRCEIDLLDGYPRLIACLLLSLLFGLLIFALTGFALSEWGLGLALLHGLLVGLAWDDMENPNGLQLGGKI